MGCATSVQCFTGTSVNLSPIDHKLKKGSFVTSGVAGARCCWPAADRHIAESAAHVKSFMVMFSRTLCLLIVLSAVARLQFSDWCDKAYTPPTAQAIGIWIDPGRNGSSSFAYRHRNSRCTELRCPVLSESPDARLPSRTLINRDLWYGLLWKKPDPGGPIPGCRFTR